MNRREFLKAAGATGVLATLNVLPQADPPLPTRIIPADKGISPEKLAALRKRGDRRIFRGPQRFAIGMPCGGIAAGQLYALGDGTLGGWHVDGRLNATGYGSENYNPRVQPRELQQGFKLVLNEGEQSRSVKLADAANGGSFENIEFIGEYPVAEVRYGQPGDATIPLDITLRIGSPFIPLNAKDSALPCTVLRFKLKNKSDREVRGQLAGWLENGIDKAALGEVAPQRRNRTVDRDGLSIVMMDAVPSPDVQSPRPDRMLFDFEQPNYDGWEVKGDAFGAAPAQGKTPHQNPVTGFEGAGLVNSFADNDDLTGEMLSPEFEIDRSFMTLLVGGGAHIGKTCVNLLVDGAIARTATGLNNEKLALRAWDVRDLAGKTARLQIVDAQRGAWGHINVDSVKLVDTLPAAAKRPAPDSLTFGTLAIAAAGKPFNDFVDATGPEDPAAHAFDLSDEDPPADVTRDESTPLLGGVLTQFSLNPGDSCEIPFVIAWCFPNLHTDHGVMYSNWFADASDVAAYVWRNYKRLMTDTDLFRKTWYDDTTLPTWLASRLFMPTANLATGTAQWWKNGRFWGWEGVGCCSGTCSHVWNYSHAEARLFPELARSTRIMQDLGTAFEESTGRVAFRGEVDKGSDYAADGQSGTVLKCYREHLCSPDDSFLKANWPRIKKVLGYQIAQDVKARPGAQPGGVPGGMISVSQPNTYDINFEGPNTFVGALYLASLLAGAKMADRMGDAQNAALFRRIAGRGREYTEARLFKDGYFIQQIPKDASTQWQYGRGCLSDQLFGQNWARCVGLETLYDERKVATAMQAVYKYNWSPMVGQYNAKFPPERWFAEGREGGLFICTWPLGERPDAPVRYRDEVWTGIEYQVAGGMLWEALGKDLAVNETLIDEALVIVNAIDERYDGVVHNPWNEVECGDHYARAMASYGVFQALCGFIYDGPAGEIGVAPRLTPDDFAAFFPSAEGWGLAIQKRAAGKQTNRFDVRWGHLNVKTVTAQVPDDFKDAKVDVRITGKSVAATINVAGPLARITLSDAAIINAGDGIEVVIST